MNWLDEIEKNQECEYRFPTNIGSTYTDLYQAIEDGEHMARVVREQQAIIQAGNKLLEIEQAHWHNYGNTVEEYEEIRLDASTKYWALFNGMSDDAKELLGENND